MTTDEIREEFVRARVEGKPTTLKELALRHGRSHDALRQAASKGRWTEVATLALADRDRRTAHSLTIRNALTTAVLERAVEHEVDVRRRHMLLARTLQGIALERLSAVLSKELPASVAVALLKLGLDEERAALGLAATAPSPPPSHQQSGQEVQRAVEVATAILDKHKARLAYERSQ